MKVFLLSLLGVILLCLSVCYMVYVHIKQVTLSDVFKPDQVIAFTLYHAKYVKKKLSRHRTWTKTSSRCFIVRKKSKKHSWDWIFDGIKDHSHKFVKKIYDVWPVQCNNSPMTHPSHRLASFRAFANTGNINQSNVELAHRGFYVSRIQSIRCIGCLSVTTKEAFLGGARPQHNRDCTFHPQAPTDDRDLLFPERDTDIDIMRAARCCQPQESAAELPEVGVLLKNSRYESLRERERSFTGTAFRSFTPKTLARAGLYYEGMADKVKCHRCGFTLMGWDGTPGLSLRSKHAEANRTCPFVRLTPTAPHPGTG